MVFTCHPSRAGAHAEQILQSFGGILQLDGYTGYDRLTRPSRKGGAPITVAHCWAHARRKLKEIFDRDVSEIAGEGLRRIAELYRIEAEIRGMGPGQRLSARQARSAPLVARVRRLAAGATPACPGQVAAGREAGLYPPTVGRPADLPA